MSYEINAKEKRAKRSLVAAEHGGGFPIRRFDLTYDDRAEVSSECILHRHSQ